MVCITLREVKGDWLFSKSLSSVSLHRRSVTITLLVRLEGDKNC